MNKSTVGKRIKDIRTKKGLTQVEFGKLIGNANNGMISKWESGQFLPGKQYLAVIAKLGGITMDELLDQQPKVEKKVVSLKILGNRIRRIRKQHGFNQDEFAELLDVSVVSISNWELGKFWPQQANLEKIADVASMDIENLLYSEKPVKAVKPAKATKAKKPQIAVKVTKSPKTTKATQTSKKVQPVAAKPVTPIAQKPVVAKKPVVQASHVIKLQLEDEITSFENSLMKSKNEDILEQAERLTVYRYAKKGIHSRIKTKKASPFLYLGKNSILDKFFEYHMKNPFRGINDDTFDNFEQALEAVFNG